MLTFPEKLTFILLAFSSIALSVVTFSRMFKIIDLGTKKIEWKTVLLNWPKGFSSFFGQNTLFKTRRIVGFIHALVAWGFTLYLLVNIMDILYGFIPGFKFFPNSIIGKIYKIFVDTFTILVLAGVSYFLLRRFLTNDSKLEINPPVMLSDSARVGMKKD